MAKKQSDVDHSIQILPIKTGFMSALLVGLSPLILNPMAAKAQRELLLPSGRKTAADRQQSLKHNPVEEFRSGIYAMPGEDAPTLLGFPASAVKAAMAKAALDTPAVSKAQIGRLVWVRGNIQPIYGIPRLLMSPVRSADINKTPDIRTRPILEHWMLRIDIEFVQPALNATAIAHLLARAGLISGIGDWRQEKGSASYGQFRLADAEDPAVRELMATGGREAQREAMDAAVPYDDYTSDLLSWFNAEIARRGLAA